MDLLEITKSYVRAGLSVIPLKVDGSKSPCVPWKHYQQHLPSEQELADWFPDFQGIGIIAGAISGNLEIIDFESHAVFVEWCKLLGQLNHSLFEKLVVVQTPGGKFCDAHGTPLAGAHVYYRMAGFAIPGSQKLAVDHNKQVLIETRGERGYVVAPGSKRGVHSSGRTYEIKQGSLHSLSILESNERDQLIECAKALNVAVAQDHDTIESNTRKNQLRPGDQLNQQADWSCLLDAGWVLAYRNGQKCYWRRPGKVPPGISATTGQCKGEDGTERLYVFSTNAKPFEAGKCYSPFAAYTLLKHEGDWTAAAKALAGVGAEVENLSFSCPDHAIQMTDLGNARKLVALYGKEFRYVHAWKKFLHWDGTRWHVDGNGQIERYAKEISDRLYQEAGSHCAVAANDLLARNEEHAQKKLSDVTKLKRHAKKSASLQCIKAMMTLAQSEPGIPIAASELDTQSMYLNCANGVIDLKTGMLKPHQREDYLTKKSPVNFIPDAACPQFINFLLRMMNGRIEMVDFLQRAMGYSITASTEEHTIFINYGSGGNGKTVFMNLMLYVLGDDYGMQGVPELLMAAKSERHPTEQADLFGKRLIMMSEVDEAKHLAEAKLKKLTGGDKVRARRMKEDFWQFDPTHTFWLATNYKPLIRGQDEGIWRRIQLIPWTKYIPFEMRDTGLFEKLKVEKEGILNWMVQGCLSWQQQGLHPPEIVQLATSEYRAEQDTLGLFIQEHCQEGDHCRVSSSLLFEKFMAFAQQSHRFTTVDFASAMTKKGFEKKRSGPNGSCQWHGLSLINQSSLSPSSGKGETQMSY